MEIQKAYLGIDNGVSGAWAVIDRDGSLIDWGLMPCQKHRNVNEIDIYQLKRDIDDALTGCGSVTCIIEEPGGSKSANAAKSMAGSFHSIRAMLTLSLRRWHRVTPQAWQKVMLPGCKAGNTKPAALELAGRLWPDERFLPTDRCSVPNNNVIDACLIAEYARKTGL
jgi:hypothetical protein